MGRVAEYLAEHDDPMDDDAECCLHNFNNERGTMTDLNSMSFDELVPQKSKYLTKDDVGAAGLILTIRAFAIEAIESDGEVEDKTVMYFGEDIKPMVLNRTNAQLLAATTGAKTAGEAIGVQVVVYNDRTVSFGGRVTGGLRLRAYEVQAKPAAPARPAAPSRAASPARLAAPAPRPARPGLAAMHAETEPEGEDKIPF